MGRNLKFVFISHVMFRLRVLYPRWALCDYVSIAHGRWENLKYDFSFLEKLQDFADLHPLKVGYTLQEQEAMRDMYEKIRDVDCIITLDAEQWTCGLLHVCECRFLSYPNSYSANHLIQNIKILLMVRDPLLPKTLAESETNQAVPVSPC